MNVPFRVVTNISLDALDNIINNIEEPDWYSSDYRKNSFNMSGVASIPIYHTPLCVSAQCNNGAIRDIKKQLLYDKYFPLIEPILNELRKHYDFTQYAAFLARLSPYSNIGMHTDLGNFLTLCHRIHIPLVTNPNIEYIIEDKSYYWEKGSIYEFDNTLMHGVSNKSDRHRIHLVINLYNLTEQELTL